MTRELTDLMIERRLTRLEVLVYLSIVAGVGMHFIDPVLHWGILQFP